MIYVYQKTEGTTIKAPKFNILISLMDDNESVIRTIRIDGQVWFVGADVGNALGYKNPNDAIVRHCKLGGIVKRYTPTVGGSQNLKFINESNVYRLISKSKLPTAEKFESWLFDEVVPTIRRTGSYGSSRVLPKFFERMLLNSNKTSDGYFSVIQEMMQCVHLRFEALGYIIPDNALDGTELRPDTSVGRCFANFIREYYPALDVVYRYYPHTFLSGRSVQARQYPNEMIPLFREFLDHVWIPEKAHNYFKDRDPKALEYLPMLLPQKVS